MNKIKMNEIKEIKELMEKLEKEKDENYEFNWDSMDKLVEYLDNINTENIIDDINNNKLELIKHIVSYSTVNVINDDLVEYGQDVDLQCYNCCKVMRIIFDRILVLLDILYYKIDEE